MNYDLKKLQEETAGSKPEEILNHCLNVFDNRIILGSSLGAEDQVLSDMLLRIDPSARIFIIDTGRLHQETYNVAAETMKCYSMKYEIYFPETKEVEEMVNSFGPNLFYDSIENREECCRIRKVNPLKRALSTIDTWITGLRKGQSSARSDVLKVEWDGNNEKYKINPLAEWTEGMVWEYIKKYDVPYNVLHDRNFPSIGCAPCTRAVEINEDSRAGRWWWESDDKKECGLHFKNNKLVRKT